MPDPKNKNPLLGAFKAPDPPKEEKKPPIPAEPPKDTKAPSTPTAPPKTAVENNTPVRISGNGRVVEVPAKPGEDKKPPEATKPTEPVKAEGDKKPTEKATDAKDGKAPATPTKPEDGKKPANQGKETKEDKTPTTSAKPGEEKKPTEPSKPADQGKETKDGKAPAAPVKPEEGNKNTEPSKAEGEKKPTEKAKDAKDGKATDPSKPKDEKKPTEPPKPAEELDENGIPKDFSMEIITDKKLGQVTKLSVDLIDDFENHPFPVRDDADMEALVQSIKQVGILEPATVIRKPKQFGRFEMVSGHRRMHAAKRAGLTHIPVIVRDMDHDEATVYMVDSNLKREIPLTTMEKARAYTMRTDALKRKTGRRSNEEKKVLAETGQKPKTADEQIAEQTGESVAQVQRLKTLTKLEEPLQKMVDDKTLPVNTAVDIAQMKPEEQKKLADAIEKEGGTVPSGSKAKELKEQSKAGTLTPAKIEAAVAPTKREVEPPLKVTLVEEDLLPYFPKGTLVPEVKKGIFEGLDVRKKLMERQAAKAKEEKAAKKKPPAPAR